MKNKRLKLAIPSTLAASLFACNLATNVVLYTPTQDIPNGGWVYEIDVDESDNKVIYGIAMDYEASESTGFSMFIAKYSKDDALLWQHIDPNFGNFALFMFADRAADNVLTVDTQNRVFYSRYVGDHVVTSLMTSEGDTLWEKTQRQNYQDHNSVAVTSDGLYLRKNSYGKNYHVTAYNDAGIELWQYESQFSDKHFHVTSEMSVDGDSIFIKDPLNISRLDENGERQYQVPVTDLGVDMIHDISTGHGKVAALATLGDEFFVILLDNNLNTLWTQSVGSYTGNSINGFVSLGADRTVCYSVSPSYSSPIIAGGAVREGNELWQITNSENPDFMDQVPVSIERIGNNCQLSVNQLNGGDTTETSTHKTISINDLGELSIVHKLNKFAALSTASNGDNIFTAGSYFKRNQNVLNLGVAGFFKTQVAD